MKGAVKELLRLLQNTQRMAVINGKPMPQVQSCIITCGPTEAHTVSIVRDGITSVSAMTCDIESKGETGDTALIVPDIAKLISALKTHSGVVTLNQSKDRLKVRSSGKVTTLAANQEALAFPHTTLTVKEWRDKSQDMYDKVQYDGYTMKDGSIREYFYEVTIPEALLKDAIQSANINGQKVAKYVFTMSNGNLGLTVGKDLLGEVHTTLAEDQDCESFNMICEGGFENLNLGATLSLKFLDFRDEGAGIHLVIEGPYGCVYQRGN